MKKVAIKILAKMCINLIKINKKKNSKPIYYNEKAYSDWRYAELKDQFVNNFNFHKIENHVILDFGSGRGELSVFLSRNFNPKKVYGIEISDSLINYSRHLIDESGLKDKIEIVKGDIDNIPLPDKCVDAIVCFDTLEHIVAIKDILQ